MSLKETSWGDHMPYRQNYPATVAEVLDPSIKFPPEALRAVKKLARSKPWLGTYAERRAKFEMLIHDLSAAYRISCPRIICDGIDGGGSGRSCYIPRLHTIVLRGRLSVVSALHEFGHALGKDERKACRWSINLFRRCFPRSWQRVRFDGHMVRKD